MIAVQDFNLKDVYPTLLRITSHKNDIIIEFWKESEKTLLWKDNMREFSMSNRIIIL